MRESALTALLAAYEVEENVSPLHAFTARFQSRFAELVYDRDEAVAVKGIQLVTLLVKAGEMPQEQARPCNSVSKVSWPARDPAVAGQQIRVVVNRHSGALDAW